MNIILIVLFYTTMIITTLLISLSIVSLLLINSLGLFVKLKSWMGTLSLFLQRTVPLKRRDIILNENGVASLKLEAQKVNEFNGDYDNWPKWKSRTECAFNGSGYERVLNDAVFASRNPKMNAIVYSQLAVATVEGNAHHLIKQHEDEKSGHDAWTSLLEWYDGDVIRNETAEALREKLETLSLHPGVSASDYVNKYMMRYQELEKIPGEGMSSSHARYLFLRNIHDERYDMTIKYLRNSSADLHECVTAIRKEERDMLRKRAAKRTLQGTLRRIQGDTKSNRYAGKGTDKDVEEDDNSINPKRVRRLTGTIETTKNGFLSIPNEKWAALNDDDKAFVQKYNAKVKHNESLDRIVIPDGVTIQGRPRRNKSPRPDTDDETKNDTPAPKKQNKRSKKVKFSVDSKEDESD